ncbi:piggyBac transposable element-derived protein 4-like [Xyrauchen texanus]|uniref:piggyBac transposable element-derived protein 4-like n=1 Tax=Xyrauchen texanus TaxID=154827 RepID=UPI0022427EE2|nr:piggyBac transposable element-derived protein 4-like [Xyrauchen texanus]
MTSARRVVYCTVQDVIDTIQNGESDADIESYTSDSSDEEVVENVEEVDKESQRPTDCPADDDDEDIEPTKRSQPTKQTIPRDRYRWVKKDFISPNIDFSGPDETSDDVSLHTPLEYFQMFVSEDMFQALTEQTNQYSFQKTGTTIKTNTKEIEQMIGMYLKMGLMQMPGVRMYWESDKRYTPVSDVMSCHRFQSLLTSLHFVNNLTMREHEERQTVETQTMA